MSEQRRRELEELLAADERAQPQAASRMSALCMRCVTELRVTGVGATVLSHPESGNGRDTRRGLVHATNDVSARLEELQLTLGEGPCLDAFTTGGPVLVADLAETLDRWPAFTSEARKLGAVAVFSFPLQVGAIRLGSLDCYRDRPGGIGEPALTDALLLADLAGQAIISQLDGHGSDDLDWLADPHTEIHQASGMVQVQLGTTTESALLRLRAHAYTRELPLTDVARQVVARSLRFRPDTDLPS